ncbi:Ran-binding protein [Vigna angularis]|uniref:Ran-binding protein n=1 Tax=Phaseolus angularis TaxID=3914 RepID=A0A8T0KF84_PHAAN|nr:Ran-binding protein [Vigna angularis]
MSESNGNSRKPNVEDQDLGLYFLEACRGREMREREKEKEKEEEEEEEEAPRELNTINSSGGFVVVSTDKLSVKYTNVNLHGHDVGVIQANKPSPTKRLIYYFEIHVKDAGVKGQISIGFTSETFKMRRQPGSVTHSLTHSLTDPLLHFFNPNPNPNPGEAFGPTYTSGDVVGAGINYAAQEFFFTKNGQVVGSVYKDLKGPLFPTIAVHSQNEEVHVNFGQKPFTFDLKEFEAQERMKQQLKIEEISVPPNVSYGKYWSSLVAHCWFRKVEINLFNPSRIVRSYLLHYGYEDTLNSFDVASKSTVPPIHIAQESGIDEQEITYALNHRKTLRQCHMLPYLKKAIAVGHGS